MNTTAVLLSFEEKLEACMETILLKYFRNKALLVYDGRERRETPPRSLLPPPYDTAHLDGILKLAEEQQMRAVTVNDKRYRRKTLNRYTMARALSTLFIFDDNQALHWKIMDPLFKAIKTRQYFKRQGPILVLICKHHPTSDKDNEEMSKNVIAAIWRWNKSINVVVMIAEPPRISFYTWFPYRHPDCRWVYPRPAYDIWENGTFLQNQNLFPKKIKRDLEACPMRVASADCVPYTFDNYTMGFEASLVMTLAKYFNFTMQKVAVPKGENLWMTKYDNGTTAGAFGLLDRQMIDLAYACLMLNLERYNLAECLPTYYHDSLTWFVPTPERKTHASNVFEAFPEQYWLYIVITTVSALCVFLLIMKLEEFALTEIPETLPGAVLRVFAMAISSPFALTTKNTLLRIFTFAFAIYSLHITTVYQASLYNLYKSNSYTNIYHNLEEAVNNNLFVWLRESTKNLYSKDDRIFSRILQDGRHDYLGSDLEDPFNQVAYEKTAIVLFIKSTMLTYITEFYTDDLKQPLMAYLPEQFASYPVTLYLSPGHPLFDIMMETMHNIIASGLVNFWFSEVVKYSKDSPPALVSNLSLQLEHISGAFMFYAVLICLAAGMFLLELIYWVTHGKKVRRALQKEEKHLRRHLLFRSVVHLGRHQITRFGRFRETT